MIKLLLRLKDWWQIVNSEDKKKEPPIKSSSSDLSTVAFSSKGTNTISAEKDEDYPQFVKSLGD